MIFLDDLCCYFRGSRTRLNDSVTHIVWELSRSSCVWLFVTLWTVAHQAPLSVGFSRQECWSGLPCLPWGDLPNLGIEPHLPVSPALQAYYLSLAPPGKPITHDQFSSVQFSHSVVSNSLWPHGLQHAGLPCPLPTAGAYSNSCPLSRWCHPTISSSVIPFSFCLQSFPATGSFQMSQFFTSGSQSIGVSASSSVFPVNIQDQFPLGWTCWISLQP